MCELCVRASRDVDHKKVFGLGGRGFESHADRQFAKRQTGRQRHSPSPIGRRTVCPVGAILKKRVGFAEPIGARKYDRADDQRRRPVMNLAEGWDVRLRPNETPVKVRLATTSLAGCFGCHMSLLDIDERLLELTELAEFDRTPLTDIKHCGRATSALIEGGVCNAENVHVLRELRANARFWSRSAPARSTAACRRMRNHLAVGDVLRKVYADPEREGTGVPNDPELPLPLDKVHPINEVVRVDYFLPGCPPSADAIWKYPHRRSFVGHMPRLEPLAMNYRLSGEPDEQFGNRPRPADLRRVAIEPVTRVEGHGKVTHPARRGQPGPSGAPAHCRVSRL